MGTGLQKSLAWCGVAFVLVLFPGLVMAGLLPPIPPTRTAEQVAQFWATNTGLKRCGLVLMLAGSALPVPFSTLIAARMKQLEGRFTPLTYAQIIGAALSVVAIMLPVCAFAAASYRPERDPQITQALNDLGWLPLVMFWPPATVQCLAIGFAVLGYRGTAPIWPRWVGYYNLWIAFIFAAGGLAVLFKTGVFAWNGLLAFWLVAAFFGTWYLVMSWQLLTTISTQPLAGGDDADGNLARLQHTPT